MIVSTIAQNDSIVITLSGSFNFLDQVAFRKSYEGQINGNYKKYILDFRQVTFIDSSSLGMILLLNDYVNNNVKNKITLLNATPQVLSIFKVANFQKLFHIKET
jgi:anti-anti-sigma factor